MNHTRIKFMFAAVYVVAGLAIAIPVDKSQVIQLEADRGQIDQKTGTSLYAGNVVVTQGSMQLDADTATIQIKDNIFQRMYANGNPASLRYKPAATKPEIHGTSKSVEYAVASGKVVMEGSVQIIRGQDIFNGEHLEYDLKNDIIRAHGVNNARIKFMIQPNPQKMGSAVKQP
jgi:lipopolysaccharide export system protein LptA